MTDAKEDGQGAWNKCPVWDGSPLTWRAFRREMTWWVSALDLESTKKYNLAARWLLRQSGTVRQRGEEFLPEELEYQREESAVDPDSGETIVLTPEDPLAGLNKLLAALESLNGQSVLDRRGELRTQFYLHLARRPGERVADYASRFRTAVSDLKSEGVKLPDPEVGWFFREKLGLDALRRQLLDTALQGAEAYGTVEAECLRLFRDLHTQDPLYRKMERGANRLTIKKMFAGTASAASSAGGYPAGRRPPGGPSSSSAGSGGLPGPRRYPPRQAQVAEIEPDEFQDEGEAELVADPNGESEERSLEEVLQAEVETLAEEIAAAEEEGVDPAHLEALESGIEASAEALVSMREARTRLAEVRKDRGYKGPAAQAGGGGKGRGRGGASAAISAKKASGKHLCFDCGGSGHWAGDPECPRPGAGAGRAKTRGPKQVRVAEVVPDNELNEVEFKEAPANEVMMLSAGDFGGALRRSLEIGARPVNEALSMTGLAPDKALVGALDSACNRTCAGSAWLEDYVEHLAEAPEYIRDLVKQEPEKESFKFGNGGILPSLTRWRIPAMIANELVCLWVSAVPVDSLGLLLGRDVLDGLQGVLDFGRRTLWCRLFGAYHAPLERLNAGHLALRLIPRSWPADCGKVRFRKVGPDGVLECCLDCREWTKQLLSARHVPTADELDHEDHSHNLTEASLALGKLAFHFGRDPSSMPVALAQSMTFEHCEARDSPASSGASVCDGFDSSTLGGPRALRGPRRSGGRPLASDVSSSSRSIRLEPRRRSAVAGQAARFALAAVSLSIGVLCGAMALAGCSDGGAEDYARTMAFESGLQSAKSRIDGLASLSSGSSLRIPGGPHRGWDDGCSLSTWTPSSTEDGCLARGGRAQCIQGGSRAGGPHASWTSGRASNIESRLDQARRLDARGGCGEGHRGEAEGQTPGHRGCSLSTRSLCPSGTGAASEDVSHDGKDIDKALGCITKFARVTGCHPRSDGNFVRECYAASAERLGAGDGPAAVGHGQPLSSHVQSAADACHEHAGRALGDDSGGRRHGHRDGGRLGPGGGAGGGIHGGSQDPQPGGAGGRRQILSGVKPGQLQQITQAWARHRRDQLLISCSPAVLRETMATEHRTSYLKGMRQPFVMNMFGDFRVDAMARARGHAPAPALHQDPRLRHDRVRILGLVRHHRPYCLILVPPPGPDRPVASTVPDAWRESEAASRPELKFAARLARQQSKGGRHFVLFLPSSAAAWRLPTFRALASSPRTLQIALGEFKVLTTSQAVASHLLARSTRDAPQPQTSIAKARSERDAPQPQTSIAKAPSERDAPQPQTSIAKARSGRDAPQPRTLRTMAVNRGSGVVLDEIMAKLLVNALEQQFDFETVSADRTGPETRECYEVLGSSGAVEFYNEVMTEEVVEPELSEDSDEDLGEPFKGEITPAIRNAVRRVHEATGHRSPRRLARALLLSGAPPAAVQAARELRCDVCAEYKRPKARRVGTLPHPRAVGEQAHIDLLLVEDAAGVVFPVCHVTDAVSKFQAAGVIADRSSKSVIEFFTRHWVPLLGAPVRLVADQGREFVSESFQEYCSSHSILLWHAAVQSPWQNSVAERSGGILKAILASVVSDQVIIGKDGMSDAVAEACAAYNQDPNAEGVSPLQCVTGRQPRLQGSVLSNFGSRLAEHGLIDGQPSYAAQMALRESARIAMIRLHFSQSIRRAELARSREPSLTTSLQPGDTVYFWRQQRASRRGDPRVSSSSRRRRLELRRWHGPAVLLALEGHPEGGPPLNAFLSFKGQVTKCCVEHIRPASTLENLAANVWEDAISELLSQVKSEPSLVGAPDMEADLPVIAEEEAEVDGSAPDEIAEAPSRDVSTGNFEEPTLSTAAPGTPVGQLFEHRPSEPLFQRPVLQQALSRARGLPLGQDLRARALLRGQPADFAAELRATMEQQALERGLKRQSESEPGADSTRRRPSATASEPPLSMRRLSNDSRELPAEIPPLPRLSSEPAGGLPLGSAVSDSRELPSEIRPLPQPSSEPAGHGSALIVEGPGGERKVGFEGVVLKHEDLVNIVLNTEVVHPLLRLQAQVELDRKDPLAFKESEPDHGSWDGRWSMPGRSQHELLQALGAPLPTGVADDLHECCAALVRKEYKWSQMDEKQRALWGKAAEKGWAAYVDNAAIEILSLKESQAVRTRLAKAGELDRIMQPRFVLTDKADGVRTPENWVPPEPSARLIVPGFQDRANLQGELRRDSPTGSRLSQHLLLSLVAWHGRLWSLLSCDVKSAFLKGDPFVARELYITGTNSKSSPDIPLPPGCLARVLKGIFGLADAPRQWWLRLARALEDRGWERSPLDQATWFLWDGPGHSKLLGVIVSHVDDLLFGGSPPAEQSLMDVGKELGFRDVQRDDFVWCGKRFTRRPDGTIVLSMQEYHENLQEIHVPKHRRGHLTSELDKQEHKKLRALLGSLQWLVAQLRFDLAFHVSALQGEKPCIGTLLRANELCREFKSDPNFELTFRPVDPFSGGLMVVTDSSLGNVTASGSSEAMPLEKVYSQSCYYVVLADRDLMEGRTGRFNILDMRSHRIPRVCRSSYASETLGAEEAFDVGQLVRGFLATARGLPMAGKAVDASINSIPLTVVVDAKDVHDKANSDTSSFGSQKSLAFTVAWLRSVLRRPNTTLRWTSTENMWVDAGTKHMDLGHLRSILREGRWSVTYCPDFVKQVAKAKKVSAAAPRKAELPLPGEPVDGHDPMLGYLSKLADQKGWHFLDGMGVNVAFQARSFRTPEPRFSSKEYPLRTTFGRMEYPIGRHVWRRLGTDESYTGHANQHALFSERFDVLITFFKKAHEAS